MLVSKKWLEKRFVAPILAPVIVVIKKNRLGKDMNA